MKVRNQPTLRRIFESEIIVIPPSLKISESSSNGSYRKTDEVWWRYGISRSCDECRFGPKKKSSPIYLGPKNLDTFWWNCQIIFRCASIHGRGGFILYLTSYKLLGYQWFKVITWKPCIFNTRSVDFWYTVSSRVISPFSFKPKMTLNNETPTRFTLTTDVENINKRINF